MSELSNAILPGDIIADILLRLPVKPICRFKCVSKPWRSLLSNPQFARNHLKLHNHDPEDFILTSSVPGFSPYILNLSDGSNAGVARKVPLESELEEMQPVVAGSCDGLLLILLAGSRSKILFNPITLETSEVLDDRYIIIRRSYGFGYDKSTEDYKIVCISQEFNSTPSLVDVYSVRTKCWKRIADSPYNVGNSLYEKDVPAPGVCLNGCIHWLGWINGFATLVCYDLALEEFKEFEERLSPFDWYGRFSFEVRVLEGCLALVSEPYWHGDEGYASIDVWVMREYGVRDSWTEFATIYCRGDEPEMFNKPYNVVCVLNEDEIVFELKNERLLAYNWRNETKRDLVIDGIPRCFGRLMPFRGSLLSPN